MNVVVLLPVDGDAIVSSRLLRGAAQQRMRRHGRVGRARTSSVLSDRPRMLWQLTPLSPKELVPAMQSHA